MRTSLHYHWWRGQQRRPCNKVIHLTSPHLTWIHFLKRHQLFTSSWFRFCRYDDPKPDISLFREASFGHGELNVVDGETMAWTWHRNDDDQSVSADAVTLKSLATEADCNWLSRNRDVSYGGIGTYICMLYLIENVWDDLHDCHCS